MGFGITTPAKVVKGQYVEIKYRTYFNCLILLILAKTAAKKNFVILVMLCSPFKYTHIDIVKRFDVIAFE